MKERVLLIGTVSEVDFPNKGKLMPTGEIPDLPEESPAGICYILPTREYGSLNIKNVLPGQKWLVSTRQKGRFSKEANPVRLLEKAPYEIEAKCPHAAFCGGCSYQTVPYEKQIEIKETQVKKLLRDIPGIEEAIRDGRWTAIRKSPMESGYRNKMEFSFGDEVKGGELTLGLHKRGAFHDILSTPNCQLVHPDMQLLVRETEAFFRTEKTSYYHSYSKEGILRHLVLRRSFAENHILLNLVTTSVADPALIDRYKDHILGLSLEGKVSGILHTINDSVADVVKADSVKILYGQDHLMEELLGLRFKIFPFSFFQTNTKGAEVLYQMVRDFAGDVSSKEVFDLYCGTGTIAQIMASAGAKSVQGIELVEEAVEAAKENAQMNALTNCRFLAGDVLKLVESLEGRPDLIILDPPRDGIHPKAMPKLLAYQPKQFIYVSCKPTSLVRDLPLMLEAGYRIEKIGCCDMFPCAVHCEAVVSLIKDEA
ncbi:MAG: 23S rRNA (uracil(1939)-C(5))-methyltransferase RlmD [Firmicutes bacterium]|nr:23S rRNA (uracil(1939)-C(5))-methyltransferase RlmD [Bacillota bacterium]